MKTGGEIRWAKDAAEKLITEMTAEEIKAIIGTKMTFRIFKKYRRHNCKSGGHNGMIDAENKAVDN